jgi:alpha-mannosidase
MKFDELTVLLPCHSIEDFPVHYEADEAETILSAWSALWHPEFIASAGAMPVWHRVDCPAETLAGRLIIVPEMCERDLAAGYLDRAQEEGAAVVRKLHHRHEMVAAGLAALHYSAPPPTVSSELTDFADDFLALGFLYLQVELLTRRMRYMSNIDQGNFNTQVTSAAAAYVAGDAAETKLRLQNCFDVLTQAREHFYPVDAYLVDVTLVADTTLGASLERELAGEAPINLLLTAADLDTMAVQQPDTLAALRRAVAADRCGILGGGIATDIPLADPETVRSELARQAERFEHHLGQKLAVWASRRFALAPWLPQLLTKLNYAGAWHVALEDGRFPQANQSKFRWEGLDGTAMDAIGKIPLDANRADSFLGLSMKLGESMDRDHVACVMLAHWPSQSACWYGDLQRASRYAPVLGKFVTIESLFADTPAPAQFVRFGADEYQSPYLKQAIIRNQPDPVSRYAREHRQAATQTAVHALDTLVALLGPAPSTSLRQAATADQHGAVADLAGHAAALAARIPRGAASEQGILVTNPCSFARRILVELPPQSPVPEVAPPVVAAGADLPLNSASGNAASENSASGGSTSAVRVRAVVEVPPLGFAWVGPGATSLKRAKKQPPMATDDHVLRNDYLEAHINPATGALQSLRGFEHRRTVVSQQLALRTPGPRQAPGEAYRDPDEAAIYSVMAADAVEVVAAGPVVGEIVSRGRLVDHQGRRLATFRQTFRIVRAIPQLYLTIEIEPEEQPRGDPWNSYYASRLAWADETAELFRTCGLVRQRTSATRIESPHYLDLDLSQGMVTLLTGGLPYHRRSGSRMLDTLLITRGETARRFDLAIALGLKQPLAASLDLLTPAAVDTTRGPAPAVGAASWLFHIDAKGIVATDWAPVVEGGVAVGFRVRMLETLGRPTQARVFAFRAIQTAIELDFQGNSLGELSVSAGAVVVECSAAQWTYLEARWQA